MQHYLEQTNIQTVLFSYYRFKYEKVCLIFEKMDISSLPYYVEEFNG